MALSPEPLKLNIAEIFYSIQGEGYHAGTAAIFIRFAGCNLSCNFCDTDFSVKAKLSKEEILQSIENYPGRFIVLTGGEPTIQPKEAKELVKLAHIAKVKGMVGHVERFNPAFLAVQPSLISTEQNRIILPEKNTEVFVRPIFPQ